MDVKHSLNEHRARVQAFRCGCSFGARAGRQAEADCGRNSNRKLITMANINGTSGSDFSQGSSAANMIFGLAGDDTLVGGAGNDTVERLASQRITRIMRSGDASRLTRNSQSMTSPKGRRRRMTAACYGGLARRPRQARMPKTSTARGQTRTVTQKWT